MKARKAQAAARIANALLGSLALAAAVSVALARTLPMARDLRFALAYLGFVPLYVTFVCVFFLADRPLRTALVWITGTVLVVLALHAGG